MPRCLNPKKAHENRGAIARPAPSGATAALSLAASGPEGEPGEQQVACQFCKYLLEGALLGDCRVVRWIGCGAFGDVYEAEQLPPLSRRVAIKVMAIERVVDGESAEMFSREVSTIAALDHPNILPVLRVGMIEDGRSYLVMKYAARGSLQQFCQPVSAAISFVPTAVPANISETPIDALSIVSAETLHIGEILTTQAEAEESECTDRREPAREVQVSPNEQSATVEAPAACEDKEAFTWQMSKTPVLRETSAHRQKSEEISDADEVFSEESPSTPLLERSENAEDDGVGETLPGNTSSINRQAPAEEASDQQQRSDFTAENLIPETPGAIREENYKQQPGAVVEDLVTDNETSEVSAPSSIHGEEQAHVSPSSEAQAGEGEEPASVEVSSVVDQSEREHETETPEISTLILKDGVPLPATALPPASSSGATILSPQQVLPYLEEAAEALYYAHQRGLIHLDVKPANLLLDAQGRLLLADFGVSVLLEGYTHASLHYYVGTPLYTAPEQWLEQPRPASDQYALAVTCYQLLTGRPPFTGNLYAVMHGHLQAPPPPMSDLNPLIPAQIEGVLQRALAKDPAARYPDVLAFACAYREALESAASASTDVQMQKRATLLLEQRVLEPSAAPETPRILSILDDDKAVPDDEAAKPEQAGTFKKLPSEPEFPRDQLRPGKRRWLRNLLLLVLALLLISGGSLGFVRAERPCWLGICPQISFSTEAIDLTNATSQTVKITNTGTDDLHWHADPATLYSWLTLQPASGILARGESRTLSISTNVDNLQSGVYPDNIEFYGSIGVIPHKLVVTEHVVKGLEAVSVRSSGQAFLYEQNHLQPGKQTIAITNNSGHTLNWFTEYTDNNWLSVTPSQGNLANKQSVVLTATVTNPQQLANNAYQVHFSLMGQLDSQSDFQLLQTLDFSLHVNQSIPVTPTVVPPGPTTSPPLSFTAQPITAPGAPGLQRSNHSMVWDIQDDQLLVFGGIDNQGKLLNDLWSYNPGSNAWSNLTPSIATATTANCAGSSPAPRMNAAMVWDSVNQQALLYGGMGTNGSYLSDLWAYSPTKASWIALACSGSGPGARGGAGVAWNGSAMLILGGLGPAGSLGDFWSYTPGSGGGWNELAASTPLGARIYPAMSWDSKDKQLYVFGGLRTNNQQLGDFYIYRPGSGWNAVAPGKGASPPARQQALSTWDSHDNVFLLMGGWQANNQTTFSAMWAYSPGQNTWWQITSLQSTSSTGVIPSRLASVMVWDSTDDRAYVYAGAGGLNKTAFNDLWMIQPG
jgi:serine/threonine protein kinase/N-acetylneuraminic acid mutarotase